MAHDGETRRKARQAFIHQRQPLPVIALTLGVSEATLSRWKRAAKADGDDWDTARAAQTIAGEGLQSLVMAVVEDYVVQHQATVEALRSDPDLPAGEKAKILASLADSFNKTVSSAGRLTPKVSELGVAMDVIRRLAEFVRERHPASAQALVAVLEPFGDHISEIYS